MLTVYGQLESVVGFSFVCSASLGNSEYSKILSTAFILASASVENITEDGEWEREKERERKREIMRERERKGGKEK